MKVITKPAPVEIDRAALIEHLSELLEVIEKGDIETAREWLRYAIAKLEKQ